MKRGIISLLAALSSAAVLTLAPNFVFAAESWPGNSGTMLQDSSEYGTGYEPSGVVYVEDLNQLVMVGDDGEVTLLNMDGTVDSEWTPKPEQDLEGVTTLGGTQYVYVGVEHPDSIKQFDLTTGEYTGKSWDLTPWMTGADNSGLEALTHVPAGFHNFSTTDEVFLAGLQADGNVYAFAVDVDVSGSVSYLDTFDISTYTDIAGLHFDTTTKRGYAAFDGPNRMVEFDMNGDQLVRYVMPGNDQEGVTLISDCSADEAKVFVSEDGSVGAGGVELWRYDSYAVTCPVEEPEEEEPEVSWPGDDGEVLVDTTVLGASYEPSGVVVDTRNETPFAVVVGDDGEVSTVSFEGNLLDQWNPGGDLEAVTIAEDAGSYVYVGVEQPDTIKQFDLATGSYTGNEWDLTPWMTSSDSNEGLEALTVVPAGAHSYEGYGDLFYAGMQEDGKIYVFNVDTSVSGQVGLVDTIDGPQARDLSGMHYEPTTGVLYMAYDEFDTLYEANTAGVVNATHAMPGHDQEGVGMYPDPGTSAATLVVAQDDSAGAADVWTYQYTVTYIETPVEEEPEEETPTEEQPTEEPPVEEEPTEEPVEEEQVEEEPEEETPVVVAPEMPTNVQAEQLKRRKFKFTWNGEGEYYKVILKGADRKRIKVWRNVTETEKTVGRKFIEKNQKYFVRVRACNEAGCSKATKRVKIVASKVQ